MAKYQRMNKPDKIILIDDNHTTNFLNEMVINRSGHDISVISFDKANNAIDFFEKEKNGAKKYLIFLDINMPEMDGWEFADAYSKIKLTTSNIIVMLTSSVDPRDKDRALNHEVIHDYHSKPLTFEVINEILNKYF